MILLVRLTACCVISFLCGAQDFLAQNLTGASDLDLTQSWAQAPEGWSYPVAVSVPDVGQPEAGFPVCILLHGNGSNGTGMLGFGENLLDGHIFVAPTGFQNSWNLCGEASEAPDVAMLADLVGQLTTFDNVDAEHIRLVGFSNGAGLVNQAFIELNLTGLDAFVAVVSQMNHPQYHEGQFHKPTETTDPASAYCGYDQEVVPPQGRRYLSICNLNDSVVPYVGGAAVGNVFMAAESAIHAVAVQQGHAGPPATGATMDGTDLVEFSYLGGDICLVSGMSGHGINDNQLSRITDFLSMGVETPECPEDINEDDLISVGDVLLVLSDFGCFGSCGSTDIDQDGIVGVSDILAMLTAFGSTCGGGAEVPTVRSEAVFGVAVEAAITYAQGLSHDSWNSESFEEMPLLLDAYVPQDDSDNHPAMVLIHGGGFIGGSRQNGQIVNLANYYAARGWVVFSIDYRLRDDFGTVPQAFIDFVTSVDSLDSNEVDQALAMYPAHRDAKAALRWVVSHSDAYGINTDYIAVGGGSAGAIISVTLGVSDAEDYRDEIDENQDPTLSTTHLEEVFDVSTILDFWGSGISVNVLEWIYGVQRFSDDDAPLIIFHGTEDPVVLFSSAEALVAQYDSTGVPYEFFPLSGYGHGPWGATVDGVGLNELSFQFIVAQQALTVE